MKERPEEARERSQMWCNFSEYVSVEFEAGEPVEEEWQIIIATIDDGKDSESQPSSPACV